jgi:hypothetical protein
MTTYCGGLIELPDGSLVHKQDGDVRPEDRAVFDGPEHWATTAAIQADFEAEIAKAGGYEAWKKRELQPA